MESTKEKVSEYIDYIVCCWLYTRSRPLHMIQRSNGPEHRGLIMRESRVMNDGHQAPQHTVAKP